MMATPVFGLLLDEPLGQGAIRALRPFRYPNDSRDIHLIHKKGHTMVTFYIQDRVVEDTGSLSHPTDSGSASKSHSRASALI